MIFKISSLAMMRPLEKSIKNHNYYSFFRHSWADELVPVITSAQTKLSVRLSQHQAHTKSSSDNTPGRGDKFHPAAHLDPGPDGYNIYGKTGHSLTMTSVPLDTKLSMERLQDQGSD